MPKLLIAVFVSGAMLVGAPFHFAVSRTKLPRDEPGQLDITESGVIYRANKGKMAIKLPFSDIREADVSDPARISLTTFDVTKRRLGGHNVFTFRLREGTHGEDLAQFFAAHLKRPVVGAYKLPDEGAFEIPAYHHGLLGGSHGTLIIGKEDIRFVSKKPKESRTWLYRDVQTIGTSDPFRFRVSSYAETFTFDLKERLPDQAYRLAWRSVYSDSPVDEPASGRKETRDEPLRP